MGDYPDHTTLTQILGTEVTIPISIVAFTVTLDVDIVAQTVGDLNINIAASDITLNVDITAQTVGNLAVNIAAAVTLDIDIVAQTVGNLAVNLAASAITLDINIASTAVTLNVDITAATIGNLTIDIEAQSVAIYNPPDWASLQAKSVDLTGFAEVSGGGGEALIVTRNVTTGKTWVIYAWSMMLFQESGNIAGYIWNDTDNVTLAAGGGAQGFSVVLPKPVRVASGKNVDLNGMNYGTDSGYIYGCIYGYEE